MAGLWRIYQKARRVRVNGKEYRYPARVIWRVFYRVWMPQGKVLEKAVAGHLRLLPTEVTPVMSQDPDIPQSALPSETADQSPQAFPRSAWAPVHPTGGRRHRRVLHSGRLPDSIGVLDRICLHDGEDYVLVPMRSILVAHRDNGVTTVELDGQSLPVRCSLDRLEATLRPFGFFRSHRAYLVNLRRVRRIIPWSRHVHHLLLDDPEETMVPLAKSRRRDLRAALLWP
jgi:hypothetical protein